MRLQSSRVATLTIIAFMMFVSLHAKARAQLANSAWPDYGGGLANTSRANVSGPSQPEVVWAYALGNDIAATYSFHEATLGSDGTIFFLTSGGRAQNLLALNPDGSTKWVVNGFGSLSAVGNWPAIIANGNLLYASGLSSSSNSNLVERNASTGAVVWTVPVFGNPFQTGPTVAQNGTIYAGDDNGTLKSLTPTGATNWSLSTPAPYNNPAIGTNGIIYTGGRSLVAIDPSGQIDWSIAALNQPVFNRIRYFTSPAIDSHGNVYVGTSTSAVDPGYFMAVDAAGHQLWQRQGVGGAPAIGPDGTIYAGYQGVLHAMSPLDGHDLWTYAVGALNENGAEGVTVDVNGNIYLSTISGVLMSLSSSGSLRWTLDLAPDTTNNVYPSAPIIGADGTLYVGGGYTGQFFAIQNVPEPSAFVLFAVAGIIAIFRVRQCGWFANCQ